jgi:hypothetical protein
MKNSLNAYDNENKNKDKKASKQPVFADSAYTSKKIEKSSRGVTLTKGQNANNELKSKTRSRIEHIFGSQKMRMGNEILKTIGIVRAKFQIGMRNWVYNISRLISLNRVSKAKLKQ